MQIDPTKAYFGFDVETGLITPGNLTPPLVCVSTYQPSTDETRLYDRFEGMRVMRDMLMRDDVVFFGQNIAYDFGVLCNEDPDLLPRVFAAYDTNRVLCTMVIEKLAQVAENRTHELTNLGELVKRYLGRTVADKHEKLDEYPPEVLAEVLASRQADPDTIRLSDFPAIAANPNILVWRTNYIILRNEPISNYPVRARDYALEDAKLPWLVLQRINWYPNTHEQVSAAWDLHLMAMEGVGVDEKPVDFLEERLEQDTVAQIAQLTEAGIYSADGKENTKLTKMLVALSFAKRPDPPALDLRPDLADTFSDWFEWANLRVEVDPDTGKAKAKPCAEYGLFKQVSYLTSADLLKFAKLREAAEPISYDLKLTARQRKSLDDTLEAYAAWQVIDPMRLPLTEKGGIKADKHTLQTSKNPILEMMASVSADKKLLSTYVPLLRKGLQHGKICPRWNVLVNTGRTSCSKPNMQNQPRKPGVRECFIPKPGNVWIDVDYATAELRSLAQVCLDLFGWSEMAQAIKAGKDLHLDFAAKMLGMPYEGALAKKKAEDSKVLKKRQTAKAANFGFPGGMGAAKMEETDRKSDYPTGLTEYEFAELKHQWLEAYPELREYFKLHGKLADETDSYSTYEQLYSGRLRGGVGYCDGCNTWFQGLTADGAKNALKLLTRDCYLNKESPLYGGRVIIFVHDEFIVEVSESALARGAVERVCELMVAGMQPYTPDLPVGTDPTVLRRWRKDAPLIVRNGVPVPYEDRDLKPEQKEELEKAKRESDFAYWWKTVEIGVEPVWT